MSSFFKFRCICLSTFSLLLPLLVSVCVLSYPLLNSTLLVLLRFLCFLFSLSLSPFDSFAHTHTHTALSPTLSISFCSYTIASTLYLPNVTNSFPFRFHFLCFLLWLHLVLNIYSASFRRVWNWNEKIRVLFCLYPCIFIRFCEKFLCAFSVIRKTHRKIKRFEKSERMNEKWEEQARQGNERLYCSKERRYKTHTHTLKRQHQRQTNRNYERKRCFLSLWRSFSP